MAKLESSQKYLATDVLDQGTPRGCQDVAVMVDGAVVSQKRFSNEVLRRSRLELGWIQ